MKRILSYLLIFSILVTCTACDSNKKVKLEVELIPKNTNGKLNVHIRTNLPDLTNASIVLSSNDLTYTGMLELVVNDGEAKMDEDFSDNGNPLKSGLYTLSFIVPISNVQPKEVQGIIGDDFSNYESEFIVESEFGTIIQYEEKIEIK